MASYYDTAYIDEIYEYDCEQRQPFMRSFQEVKEFFLTGSAAEGAFIYRGVWETVTNIEMDFMKAIGKIPMKRKDNILVATDSIGYYHLRWNGDLKECLHPEFSQSLLVNDYNLPYLSGEIIDLYNRFSKSGNHKNGTPNILSDTEFLLHIEMDFILCIELPFWPDVLHPWFQRKRF